MMKMVFEKKLGNLEVLRKVWRFETLRKVLIFLKFFFDEV